MGSNQGVTTVAKRSGSWDWLRHPLKAIADWRHREKRRNLTGADRTGAPRPENVVWMRRDNDGWSEER